MIRLRLICCRNISRRHICLNYTLHYMLIIAGLSSLGRAPGTHQEALTKYLLSRLLGNSEEASPYSQRRDSDSSYKFPLVRISQTSATYNKMPIILTVKSYTYFISNKGTMNKFSFNPFRVFCFYVHL